MSLHRTLTVAVLATVLALSAVTTAFAITSQMGNPATNRGSVDSSQDFTIVDTNHPAAFDGVFDSITYYAGAVRDIRFVIVDSNQEVTWVSDVISPGATGVNTASFDAPVGVTQGSNLGVYSVGAGAVSYERSGDAAGAAWEPNRAGLPVVGETLTYENTAQGRYYSMNLTISATSPDLCKDGGWETYGYKNQGQCIASVVANEHADKA